MARLKRGLHAIVVLTLMVGNFAFLPVPHTAEAVTQDPYRWRNDDGSETTAAFAAAEGASLSIEKEVTKRLRLGITNDGTEEEFERTDALSLPNENQESNPSTSVIDTANGFMYVGTETSPAIVVKIDLSTGARVGSVVLESGENFIRSGVIDTVNGFAYFGTETSPGRVVKIDLSDFTRDSAVTLSAGENFLTTATIDVPSGFAYFGTETSPGRVVKIDLSDFTRDSALTLSTGDDYLRSAITDVSAGFAYFGTETSPGRVVKIDLSDFTRDSALDLSAGENFLRAAAIDATGGFAYFGTHTLTTAYVVKVNLSTFARDSAVTLPANVDFLASAVIDTTNGFLYFGRNEFFGGVVKVDLSPFEYVDDVEFDANDSFFLSAVIDVADGYAYFTTRTSPAGIVMKIDLDTLERAASIGLDSGQSDNLHTSVIDQENGFAYFGSYTSPASIVKFDLATMTRVGAIALPASEFDITTSVIDTVNDFAYFGTEDGYIVKVNIDPDAFGRVASLAPETGEDGLYSSVIDVDEGFAYFGNWYAPGKVIKINLSTFTRVGAIELDSGENDLESAVIDTVNGFAYFGTATNPGRVVKIDLSTFARVGAVTLDTGENFLYWGAVIDQENEFAYFATDTSPGRIVKIDVDPSNFARIGAVTLETGENSPYAAAIDANNGYAYFGTSTSPINVVKLDILPSSTFARDSAIALNSGNSENSTRSAVIDARKGYAFFAAYGGQRPLVRVGVAPRAEFRLEYGAKSTTCGAIGAWTQVPASATSEHWEMSDSANLTEGALTTDSAGLSDGNVNFKAGEVKDTSSQTSQFSLGEREYTEVEYSIRATADATSGGDYCFRVTDAGTPTDFTYTSYAEATVQSASTNEPTTSNSIVMSRHKIGTSSTIGLNFTLQNEITGTLTVTFPASFTITGAFTSGTCASGTIGTFGFDNGTKTLTAEKTACSGAVNLSGAVVTLPGTVGLYEVTWTNDDPGSTIIPVVDDDQVSITATVDSEMTFDIDTDTSDSDTDAPYTVPFGTLTSGAVTGSDDSGVNGIWVDLDTNASGGAVVQIRNANGANGLASASVPTDTIPSLAGENGMVAGTANYGVCVSTAGLGTPTATTGTFQAPTGDFDGTCGTTPASNDAGGLTTTFTDILNTNTAPIDAGRAQIRVMATISDTTGAHDDYSDVITLRATGTF